MLKLGDDGKRAAERHRAQQRQGEAGARRGGLLAHGAPHARHRDRAHRQDGGVRFHLCRPRAFEPLGRRHGADLHGRAGGGTGAVRARARQHVREHPARARRRGAGRDRAQRALGARGACRGGGGEVSAAGRARGVGRPAAPAVPLLPGRRGQRRTQRGDHGDRPVRERTGRRQGRGDRRRRGRRHGADRHQRPAGGHGAGRPVRARQGARGLRPHDRGLPQARQARGRRRAGVASRSSWPSSSSWARATSRPARTLASCWPRPPAARNRCAISPSDKKQNRCPEENHAWEISRAGHWPRGVRWRAPRRPRSRRCGSPSSSASAICR